MARQGVWRAAALAVLYATGALGQDILRTSGFTNCDNDPTIVVNKVDIRYNNDNKTVIFDFAGRSNKEQNVTAHLDVFAYGNSIYSNSFNPCDAGTFVQRLCPLPEGPFSAWGMQEIPAEFANMVPSIAFQVPDIAAQAKLELKSLDTDESVACIQSQVSNGKTADVPAVSYVAAGIAGAALVASGVSALGAAVGGASGGGGGSGTMSPGFTEVVGWFQGLAMNGMMSVNYPPVYRSFTKNFAFSTGLIAWKPLQTKIDQFRAATGGNLTENSVAYLENTTLLFAAAPDSDSSDRGLFKVKRALETFSVLVSRQNDDEGGDGFQKTVSGLKAFAEQLQIPDSDVFMTILMIVAIGVAAIILGILLFKVILEVWVMWGELPKGLDGFRQHYWGTMARTITSLIFVFYGIWVLWCIFQFTRGDSWAATALAAVTLAIFTAVLVFFAVKIMLTVRKMKAEQGDINALYNDKSTWTKYSLFYDAYRHGYWWIFTPVIFYMLVKGCVLAAADGSGRAQTISILIIEGIMLALLLWSRPYERKSGNVINIIIQVVRVLSMVCILVFVEEFGIQQTTQTVTGVVLIAVQSALTVVLVILIAWNGINACCRANPHRQRRKELEKLRLDSQDDLTPLGARNTLLLDRPGTEGKSSMFSLSTTHIEDRRSDPYSVLEEGGPRAPVAPSGGPLYRPFTPTTAQDVRLTKGSAGASFIETPMELKGMAPTFPSIGSEPRAYNGGYRGY